MKEELQIKSYGVANTSLEQVFLKVAEQAEQTQINNSSNSEIES